MIRLETGSPSDYWPRISGMARDVAAEVMGDSSIDIDVGTYEAAYEAGMLITCFALDGDDVVGFSVAWVAHDPHDAGTTRATSDVIYVRPSHRNTAAGSMLINETELMAKDRGAMFMSWGAADGSTMQSLLFARGYKRSSLYTRQL